MLRLVFVSCVLSLTTAQYGNEHGYGDRQGGFPVPALADSPPAKPYQYGYDIVGGDGETDFKQTRQETGDGHGNVRGSYGYTDSHGNQRQVDYIADGHGFRAQIRTNEPGTDNQNPADVEIHAEPPKNQPPAIRPSPPLAHGPPPHGPLAHGPIPHAPPPHAPLAHGPLPHGPHAHGPLPHGPHAHGPLY